MAFLEVNNIIKSFGKTEVLKGVSFTLNEGEVLSIIGPSGNGKTTLLRCLNYLEFIDDGEVYLNGDLIQDKNVKTLKEKAVRNKRLHFGMVFQSFNLFPQYTAKQNVSLALSLMEKERAKNGQEPLYDIPADKVAENLLERVGLLDKMNNYPCELSGGQCQRVAIARAMALKPDILCFDEPTSALDPELTGEVLKVIKELKQSTGMTMIIVTHEMEFAKNISDKVMFMWDGKVCEFGTPDKVLEHPEREETKHFLQSFLENKQ